MSDLARILILSCFALILGVFPAAGQDNTSPDPERSVIAPREDEPPAISYEDAGDGIIGPTGNGVPETADPEVASGVGDIAPVAPESLPSDGELSRTPPAGVNASCTALTNPAERDLCRMGSVAGQPALPPGER